MADKKMEADIIFEPHVPHALSRALEYACEDGFVASMPQLLNARTHLLCNHISFLTMLTELTGCHCHSSLHVQRIYAQKDHFEEFSKRFVERARRLIVGDKLDEATDMGPMTSDTATLTVAEFVEDAVAQGARIFTRNLATAHRVADALNCGGVMINDSSDYRIDAMPFGGTRSSGLEREGVPHAIHEMTDTKTYCFNL